MTELILDAAYKDYFESEDFKRAVEIATKQGKISTSLLQRKLTIGYGKAATFIDVMEAMGIISSPDGTAPRKALVTYEQWTAALPKKDADAPKKKCDMIIVLLADGFEEIEALTPVDMLRRAGLNVKTVAVNSKIALGSHGIPVICDMEAAEVPESELSMVIFPGGMPGSLNLDASPYTDKFISAVQKNGGRIVAICAAPLVLGRRGLLEGKEAICYPGFEEELRGAKISKKSVVTDENITTAKGMGVALQFATELVSLLSGNEKAAELKAAVMDEE